MVSCWVDMGWPHCRFKPGVAILFWTAYGTRVCYLWIRLIRSVIGSSLKLHQITRRLINQPDKHRRYVKARKELDLPTFTKWRLALDLDVIFQTAHLDSYCIFAISFVSISEVPKLCLYMFVGFSPPLHVVLVIISWLCFTAWNSVSHPH